MRLSIAIAWAISVLLAPAAAHAYPQFQLVLEESCSNCHIAQTGGGVLNLYGRDAAGTAISSGGDGNFLHGAWDPPEWLAIGGDARFATGASRVAGDGQLFFFPMQSELYFRAMRGGLSVTVNAGLRGAAREPEPTYVERLASREHYVSYETDELLMRVGRFYPVFGLRLPDHTAYVRRHLGQYLQEEPYALGISHFGERTETHVTAFVRQPISVLGAGYQPSGVTALVERKLDDDLILGPQARLAVSDEESRFLVGGIAKIRLGPKSLLLAELDLQRQWFRRPSAGAGRMQIAGYVGISRWLRRGLLVAPSVHLWDPDLALEGSYRAAADVQLQWFPRAHWELHLILRTHTQGDISEQGFLSLLVGHYYL